MFISVLFIITKRWKQVKYPPTDELINKACVFVYIAHTMEYYSVLNGSEVLIYDTA